MTKGLIKIELFDVETGRKTEEVDTHNFIAKGVQHLFEERMRSLFTQNRAAGGENYQTIGDPFRQILLTTANHPEDPENEWFPQGDIIGDALSTSSNLQSAPTGGRYNSAESFTNSNQVRMVFDFPTDRANGTFQSIYFRDSFTAKVLSDHRINSLDRLYKIFKYDNNYWVKTTSLGSFNKYDADLNLIKEYSITGLRDFTIVDDIFYFVGSNYDYIRRFPLSEIENPTPTTAYTHHENKLGTISSIGNDLYVSQFAGGSTTYDIIKLNVSDFTKVSVVGQFSGYAMNIIDGVIFGSNHISTGNGVINITNNSSHYVAGDIDERSFALYDLSGTPGVYRMPKALIGSRSLLSESITKTNKQTMKITYDFILPPLWG